MLPVITEKEIKNRYRGLLRSLQVTPSLKEQKQIRKAYQLVVETCKDRKDSTGVPYIFHVVSVARIVSGETTRNP